MAERITLVDDLDGTPITDGRGGTIRFSIDDTAYDIDLNLKNTSRLRAALAPFTDVARTTSATGVRRRVSVPASAGRKSPEMLAAIRHWARQNGHTVPATGRIPAPVQAAFDAAH
jgi:hypothetical protein